MDSLSSANLSKRTCQINDLADADLSKIFKHLPLYERLRASEVCRRWHGLSRMQWLDVTKLDLNPILSEHIAPIVNQCPNLQSAVAVGQAFAPYQLARLTAAPRLSTLKLYDCKFESPYDVLLNMVSTERRVQAPLREMILHDSQIELILDNARLFDRRRGFDHRMPDSALSAAYLPTSLTRLQLSGDWCLGAIGQYENPLLEGVARLENLECFILNRTCIFDDDWPEPEQYADCAARQALVFQQICELKNLKELCLGPGAQSFGELDLGRLVSGLPKLEVLFIDSLHSHQNGEALLALILNNSTLRILVLSACFGGFEAHMPARKRFPRGFGSAPLPLLHIFLCGEPSENFRFSESSSSEAAVCHVIVPPTAQFLEREDIAPIFAGVWMAQAIKDTAANGGRFWRE